MLQQKPSHKGGQQKPTAVARGSQNNACKGERRRVGLDGALDIPLAVKLSQTLMNPIRIGREVADACGHFVPDAAIDLFVSVKWNSFTAACHDRAP
jgi:hypothetical protein